MGQRKFEREVDHTYISKNGKFIFLITLISGSNVVFRSFDRYDGHYIDTKTWSDTTFRDRVEREATHVEMSLLDLEVAVEAEKEMVANWERRQDISLAKVSKLELIREVQRRGLVEDILSVVATKEEFLAAARRRGFDLTKKSN